MKKTFICLLALMLLSGCSQGEKQQNGTNGATGGGSVSVKVENKEKEKSAFNSEKVLENILTNAYTWNTDYDNCLALVIKNNSSTDCKLTVDVSFKDAEGNLLGAKDDTVQAFGVGGEICLVFDNEEPFANYEYNYSVQEIGDYYEAVNADLTCEASPAKNKVIVSATNNGSKIAEYVTGTALFMKGEQIIDSSYAYIGDDELEIKPGSKETDEIHCFEDFDSVKVYLSGYASKS